MSNYIHPFSNFIITHSLHMVEPLENTTNPFITLHSSLICTFGTLSILLIPRKSLRFYICTAIILRPLLFLPYHMSRQEQCLIQSPCTLKLQIPNITQGLIIPAHFHPLTTFLQHSSSSVPDSPKMQPKSLNSDICSKHFPSIQTWAHACAILVLCECIWNVPSLTCPPRF